MFLVLDVVIVTGKSASIWDEFTQSGGKVSDGHNGNTACDSYHKVLQDVRCMKELGVITSPLPTWLAVCLSVCLSVVCLLSACLSVCLSAYVYIILCINFLFVSMTRPHN